MSELPNEEFLRNPNQAVSSAEFAKILGVYKSTVSRAIKDKRLKNSLVKEGTRYKILIYQGCIEWYLNKNLEKDRYSKDSKDFEASKCRREFFRSMLTQLEYLIKTGDVISFNEAAQAGAEVCLAARQMLENRRDIECFQVPGIKDNFEARKFLKDRDEAFLRELACLSDSMVQIKEKAQNSEFSEEATNEG